MKSTVRSTFLLFCLLISQPVCSASQYKTEKDKYSFIQTGMEIGGSALVYSLFGSIRLIPNLALNLGITFWGLDSIFLPGSVSLLIGEGNNLFELLGGGGLGLSNRSSSLGTRFTDTDFVPELGIGYRYWPKDGGFHFRAILYLIFLGPVGDLGNLTLPFPGLSFGYAF